TLSERTHETGSARALLRLLEDAALEAFARVLGERLPDGRLEPRRDPRSADRRHRGRGESLEPLEHVLAHEGGSPREALVKHRAERKDVGCRENARRVEEL